MNTPGISELRPFRACLRFEATKLACRKLCWWILAATVGVVIGAGLLEARADDAARSWELYAALLETTMPIAAFFLLVTGCIAVNEEVSSGSLRAVLLRPIPREIFLGCKILCILVFAGLVAVVLLVSAWAWTKLNGGFSDVVLDLGSQGLESVVKFEEEEIGAYMRALSLASIPPLLCAPLFGVLVSILVESTGFSVALGVFGFGLMKTLGGLGGTLAAACFPAWLDRSIALMDELSRGVETRLTLVQGLTPFSPEFFGPLLLAAIFAFASILVFQSKEIRC